MTTARKVFLLLGVLSFGAALSSRVYLSSGALEFEGVGPHGEPRARWLAQRATIPVYGPEPLWVFKTTPLMGAGTVRLEPPSNRAVTLDVTNADQAYLPMYANHAFWPTRYAVVFQNVYDAWVRQLSGQIVYPPLLMPIPLLMTRGVSEVVPSHAGATLRCSDECWFAMLHRNEQPTTVHLALAPLFTHEPSNQSVEVEGFASVSPDRPVSLNAVADLVSLGTHIYKATDATTLVALDIPPESHWYKLRIALRHSAADLQEHAMQVILSE